MYLSYSGFKLYVSCAFAYWNEYINKTQTGKVDDRLGSIYGSVVGKLFEDFYKLKVWKQELPQEFLMNRVEAAVDEQIRRETSPWKDCLGGVLLWKGSGENQNPKGMYTNRAELVADVRDTVSRGFRIIRQHRLMGPRMDAEYKLDFVLEGDIYAGRADFIIERTRPTNDLVIVDGKGSKHRGKYVDPQQLQWYSMLSWLHSVKEGKPKLPDRLAFLYWRYDPDECMDWLDVTQEDVEGLLETAREVVQEIVRREKMMLPQAPPDAARGVFPPKANEKNCRFCPYDAVCPPGRKVQEAIKQKKSR